jgi:ADP-heptose:LPS heptosyltransferase
MATQKQQNLPVNGIKVIAIKLPFDLQERILSFPFLHTLRSLYPESEIHFITPKVSIEVLNLLPFKAFYHEFDENEISSIFDVHRFCVSAKIYNVDLFISLTNSFPDACLGLGLGFGLHARYRLGFSDGWKTMVLNQKTPRPRGHHLCEDFLALYSLHSGKEFDPRMKIHSREIESVLKDPQGSPYVAIDLSPLRDASIEQEWVDLVSKFEGQRIVFFASHDQDRIQNMMDTFLAILPRKNTYENFRYKDWIDLAKMLAHARGVIAYQGALPAFSAYLGTRTLILYDREDPQKTAPFYFICDVAIMGGYHAVDPNVVIQKRTQFNMDEVFEKAMAFFSLQ